MQEARLARALTKHTYTFGVPAIVVVPCYLIPVLFLVYTGWIWELIPAGAIIHLWLRFRYIKDEYWFSNYIRALRMENYLEP